MKLDYMYETLIGLVHTTALMKTIGFMVGRSNRCVATERVAYCVFLDRILAERQIVSLALQ